MHEWTLNEDNKGWIKFDYLNVIEGNCTSHFMLSILKDHPT